ncbi:class I adenylate-forming enzyme family protein [Halovenus rubra]|uniref:Class I adenylate-forming enzyme family protein n=2 Tax=Halovenus rubra TaxID=869890 RepID=A0ACC7E214_9EURY
MSRYTPDKWPARSPLFDRCAATPNRAAVIAPQDTECLTYADLAKQVSHVADGLWQFAQEHGLVGDQLRVGYLFQPGIPFVTTLYALWEVGWTAVGIQQTLTADETETHAAIAGVDMLVVGAGSQTVPDAIDCPTVTADSLIQHTPAATVDQRPAQWERDETALILFTSGTTGRPKAVRLTLGNLVASATASAFRFGLDARDRWLCCLPVSHMGGLAPAVRTVCYGTTLVLQPEFDPSATATVLNDRQITQVSLVPTQLKRLLEHGWRPSTSLDTVLLGGAPTTEELLTRANEAEVPVYTTYGMTETASGISVARPAQQERYPGTVGQPLVGTTVTILNDRTPAAPGVEGEIVVDGPTVTPGYLDEAATESRFSEYGFHTGDLGYQDEAGRLWVNGRVDDVINTGGELVSPAGVVDVLLSLETVADAAVVGVPDEKWGERVSAIVVPAEGTDTTEQRLRERCRDNLAPYKVPKLIQFEERVPRTASGTVDREAVRRQLE